MKLAKLALTALLAIGLTTITPTVPVFASTSTPPCGLSSIFPWASTTGDGTAGTIYYEIELSNISSSTCTLIGFPSVWAINEGTKVGLSASHNGTPVKVTLTPLSTAHVLLGVVDTGALCPTGLPTMGLEVIPPGFRSAQGEQDSLSNFPLSVCATRASMHVSAVEPGVGIPLYTQ